MLGIRCAAAIATEQNFSALRQTGCNPLGCVTQVSGLFCKENFSQSGAVTRMRGYNVECAVIHEYNGLWGCDLEATVHMTKRQP